MPEIRESEPQSRGTSWIVGLAMVGSVVAGVAGLFAGLWSFLSGNHQAAGVCLLAAAVAFGSLANAVLRR